MIITCDNCNTSFELEDNLVKEGGSKVRCANCDHVFTAHPESQIEESDILELSDLDMEIEMEEVGSTTSEFQTDEQEDLVLEIESGDESDALDFSELEKLLEMESSEETVDEDDAGEPELELELDLEDETSDADMVVGDESEDLDLSDLEEMLKLDESDTQADDAEEPELELELEVEADAAISVTEAAATAEDELDLSDIEKLLEMDDLETHEPAGDEEELHLELDLDEDETPDESLELNADVDPQDLNFELEESGELKLDEEDLDAFALMLEEDETSDLEAGMKMADSDEGDVDLDFDIEEANPEEEAGIRISEVEEDEEETTSAGFGMGTEKKTAVQATQPAARAFTTSLPIPKKRSKFPALLVVLLLLMGSAVGGYFYMDQQGMLPITQKSGEIIPLDDTFNHTFVDNQNIGSLFVITGFVENKYKSGRSNISVTGELLTDQAAVAQTQTVYCGNILSEMELSSSDMDSIKQRLGNASGDKQSNINVKPGTKLPFMVVFSNLPDSLAEYRIQIAGSLPVEK